MDKVDTLTKEQLQAIIDGCEKLPHGPWFHGAAEGKNGTAGLAQVDNGAEMWPVIAEWPEAAHIARLDPATVKAICTLAMKALSPQPMAQDADKLREENEQLQAAIDSAEIEHGLTTNGNLWRFWSKKSQELAATIATQAAEIDQAWLVLGCTDIEGQTLAGRIMQLRVEEAAEIVALQAALRPFAEKGILIPDYHDEDYTPDWSPFIPVGAYRNAARALPRPEKQNERD